MGAVRVPMMAVVPIAMTLIIGRIRREGTWAGKGRALIDIVILWHRPWRRVILQFGIGQPLIVPIGLNEGRGARADVAATRTTAASRWRPCTRGHHADACENP